MTRWICLAALACAMPVYAQDAEEGSAGPVETRDGTFMQSADDIDVRNTNGDVIGEIEEILIDSNGQPAGFLIEMGGFLDLADTEVAVPLDALTWDGAEYVSKMTEEQLQNLAPFDE
ncbi:PRC-barrel domain-containing protein [Marivita sp. S0852]|uniref:PRC-barrel domain-containing protein n=1 Tax=Marivita sp. S0852 TaxID=3373893 RepID=UPI003981D8B5